MITVVIVDKDLIARKGIKEFFRDQTISIIGEADCASVAIDLIREHKPDIVALNPNILDMPGSRLAQIISRSSPKTRIVFMLGNRHLPTLYRILKTTPVKGLLTMNSRFSGVEAIHCIHAGDTYIQPDLSYDLIQYWSNKSQNAEKQLSPREYEVLALSAQGKNVVDIAESCSISEKTVYNVKSRAMKKLGIKIIEIDKLREAIFAGNID